jgi:drug/metabolite transporter (DMT)-like permease
VSVTKLLIILLIGLTLEAVGVVYLNKGLKQVGDMEKVSVKEVFRMVKRGITNTNILLGVFFEALFFACLLILMSKGGDVSFIWPLTALGFVFTTIAAKFILGEQVSPLRWSGVCLIVLGAGLITYSEKLQEAKKQQQPVSSETSTSPSHQ